MDRMKISRGGFEVIVSKRFIRSALQTASPNQTAIDFTPGSEVFVYREKDRWKGSYDFLYCEGILSVVLNGKGYEHRFHNTMLNTYHPTNLPIKDIWNSADPAEIDPDITTQYIKTAKKEHDACFKHPRQKERDGIKAQRGVIIFNRSALPSSTNIMENRFTLGLRDSSTKLERLKAWRIFLGLTDLLRQKIANNSLMLMRLTFHIILFFTVLFFLLFLWLRDV